MNSLRLRLTSLSLIACTALALTSCATSNDSPTDLGPGIVTPGGLSTGSASPSTPSDRPSDSPGPSTSKGAPAVPLPFRDNGAELDAENQTGDGRGVRVEDAALSRADGFVAVYASDGEQLLGYADVKRSADDDVERPVTVKVEQRLSGSNRLLVVLHADDGDGRFEPTKDPRVTGDDDDNELEVDRLTYRVT